MSHGDDATRAEREAMQRQTNLAASREDTDELRHSYQPRWERLRRRLEQAGIRPEDAAIVTRNTEDTALEFGILIVRDGRAFGFEFDFLRDEDGRRIPYEDARVSAWEELDQGRRDLYEPDLQIGREVLEREAPAG